MTRIWFSGLTVFLLVSSGMFGCKGLTSPGSSSRENGAPIVRTIVRVVDTEGSPVSGANLLYDNRQYEKDREDWSLFNATLDADGIAVIGWEEGSVTDLVVTPIDGGGPAYRFLSVTADSTSLDLVYPLTFRSFGVELPAGIELDDGEMTAVLSRPRIGDAPPYQDRYRLELDSTLTMSGWLADVEYSSRAVFYGPDEERLEFRFEEPVRPDSARVALGLSIFRPRPVELVWPDSLPVEPVFGVGSETLDPPAPFSYASWHRHFTRSSFPGRVPVPDGPSDVDYRRLDSTVFLGTVTSADRSAEYDGASILYLGDHWIRVARGAGWAPEDAFRVLLSVGYISRAADFGADRDALILAAAADYALEIRRKSDDTRLELRVLQLDQNYDFVFDAPGVLRLR